MKFKFMTQGQASKDQHRLKKNIQKKKYKLQKEEKLKKRKGRKDKVDGKGSRKTRCLIESHPCLVAFVYKSDNNVVSQRFLEKLKLPTSFHLNQARIKFSTG